VARYIWQNPVRSGIISCASAYRRNGSLVWPIRVGINPTLTTNCWDLIRVGINPTPTNRNEMIKLVLMEVNGEW